MKPEGKLFSNFFSSIQKSLKKLDESWKNSKLYKGVRHIKSKLAVLHDYLRTEDLNKLPESEIITPYLFVFRWFLDIILYGSFISFILWSLFRVQFTPLSVLGLGLLRWLIFDLLDEFIKTIKK